MTPRPAALLITPELPSPAGSGLQQRAFHWLTQLAEAYAVTLLVVEDSSCRVKTDLNHLMLYATHIDSAVVTALPVYTKPFHCCLVFRMRMHNVAQAVRRRCKIPMVLLDMDDLESATLASIALVALRRGRLRLAARNMMRAAQAFFLERYVPLLYQGVFLAAPEDLKSLPRGTAGVCVPNVPPPVGSQNAPPVGSPSTLLFVGTLNYFPNEDAALWLATEIAPRLRQLYSEPFRILIAGRNASARLQSRLAGVPEIEFLGEVPCLHPLYERAHIVLVPLRCGGGTKLKALEAVAHRRPIVGTTHAGRGLPLRAGSSYLAADGSNEFAAACVALMRDPAAAESLARLAADTQTTVNPPCLSNIMDSLVEAMRL